MKNASLALLAALLVASSSAITLRRTPQPRVMGLGIQRNTVSDPIAHDRNRLARRSGTVSETLDNEVDLYYANVTLGTPSQAFQLHIDTGSSDLWVNVANSSLCENQRDGGCQGGTYSPTSSSTYAYVNSDFNISYADGTGASGDYVKDTLHIGGQTLTDFQFGLGFISDSSGGVLGVGYATNEAQVDDAGLSTYANLPQALVNAGVIASNAYSLWLNDLDAATGTILFGGVNSAKYTGSLATVPIIQEYGEYLEFIIALTGLSIGGIDLSSSSSLPAPVLLDCGTTLTYLPDDLTTDIYNQVNAVYDSDYGYAFVECSLRDNSSSIDYVFSGQTISVSFNELVLEEAVAENGRPLTFPNGAAACTFGIAPTLGTTPVLGDTFLRSAYVVYDLKNNEISIAQTDFNSTGSDIHEIDSAGSVPGAAAVASPVTTVAAGTGGARLNGPSSTLASSPTGLSSGAVDTYPVQVAGGVLAAVAVIFALL